MASVRDCWLFASGGAAAMLTEFSVRCLPLPRACRLLGVRSPAEDMPELDWPTAQQPQEFPRLIEEHRLAVQRVYRKLPLPDTCLRRALTLGHLLRNRKPILKIGVNKGANGLNAHAWLILEEGVLDPNRSCPAPMRHVLLQRP